MTLAEAIKALTLHLGVLESSGWGEAPMAQAIRVVLAELGLRCSDCGSTPEEHGDSDHGPMTICPGPRRRHEAYKKAYESNWDVV